MQRLENKVAAITGAAQGIGAALAHVLAENGAQVVVTDIVDPSATVNAIKAAGGQAVGLQVDVTKNDRSGKHGRYREVRIWWARYSSQ